MTFVNCVEAFQIEKYQEQKCGMLTNPSRSLTQKELYINKYILIIRIPDLKT